MSAPQIYPATLSPVFSCRSIRASCSAARPQTIVTNMIVVISFRCFALIVDTKFRCPWILNHDSSGCSPLCWTLTLFSFAVWSRLEFEPARPGQNFWPTTRPDPTRSLNSVKHAIHMAYILYVWYTGTHTGPIARTLFKPSLSNNPMLKNRIKCQKFRS